MANVLICRVPELAHDKKGFCHVQQLCRVPDFEHTATMPFPVVKKVSCAMVIKEENARLIAENKDLQAEIRVLKKRLSETKNGDM